MAKRREFISTAAALMASSVLPLPAAAQTYPARPIKYICPWPAGGSTDVVMRSLAEAAGRHLGQAIIVENRPGAGGTLGALDLVNAKPDGYTVAQLPHGVFRLPHMQKVAFDTLKDFTWIACLTGYTFGLVVQAESPFKTIKDLVDYARLNPGKLSYGSTGVGTSPHLAVEEFAQRADIKLNHIPFKGNAENMQALMGGHIASASDATGWGRMLSRASCAYWPLPAASAPSAGRKPPLWTNWATKPCPTRPLAFAAPRAWSRRSPGPSMMPSEKPLPNPRSWLFLTSTTKA